MKLADGVTQMIRSIVMFDAFRQLMRALALPNSPNSRKLPPSKEADMNWKKVLRITALTVIPGGLAALGSLGCGEETSLEQSRDEERQSEGSQG